MDRISFILFYCLLLTLLTVSSSDQDKCDDDLKIGPSDHPSQIFTESDF